MNKLLFLIFIPFLSCSGPQPVTDQPLKDNPEVKILYQEDQGDRLTDNIDWAVVSERDAMRQARVYELLDSGKVRTAADYSNAAMIFQHGSDTVASGMAVKLMKMAVELDSGINKWLLAAAIDRDLMRRGEPQIFGTQFRKDGPDEPWVLYELDTTRISQEERAEYNVPTLAQQRERVRQMNKRELSELLAEGKSVDEIVALCRRQHREESIYDLSEMSINQLGYTIMAQSGPGEALKLFALNVELYPEGFNTHDSYGECLRKLDRIRESIEAYEESLELNPDNSNARQAIEEMKQEKST